MAESNIKYVVDLQLIINDTLLKQVRKQTDSSHYPLAVLDSMQDKQMKKKQCNGTNSSHYPFNNESMVSFVSKRYTIGRSGTESLMICLSEYLPLLH